VNPTLTIIANALRVGDHLLERLAVRTAQAASLARPKAISKSAMMPAMAAIA
jgi:hypothetical protein